MKRLMALLLAVMLVLGTLAGCGGGGNKENEAPTETGNKELDEMTDEEILEAASKRLRGVST